MKRVFLTGAAGVVGQAILDKATDAEVVCLVHHSPLAAPGVKALAGDITRPGLGLSHEQLSDLTGHIDYVVHSAAATGFGDDKDLTFRTNVAGTVNALEFARQASATFCHISTAFAHLEQLDGNHASNAYEASKLEAERLVRASGVPYVILRPSVVIGDSNDGHMSRFQGFHFLCELMVRGVLPVWVPALPTSYMDFIPQDIVAEAVWALVHDDIRGEFWLTAGDRALQVGEAVKLWQQHLPRLTGRPISAPRYVGPDVIDRLVRPVFLPSLPERTQTMVNQALELLSFSVEQPLPSSLPELESLLGLKRMPNPTLSLIRNAEYWAGKRGFLKTAARAEGRLP